jgi:hypothetical protein
MARQAILFLLLISAVWAEGQTQRRPQASPPADPQPSPAMGMPAAHTVSPMVPKAVTTTLSESRKAKAKAQAKADQPLADAQGSLPAEAVPSRKTTAGRRDPFVSPVVSRPNGPSAGCATGKRCLVIDQMALKGIVQTVNGMIAVVANSSNKAYFLREKDPVFNGYVLRITADAVVFKENTVNHIGRTSTREVVKKVSAPVV